MSFFLPTEQSSLKKKKKTYKFTPLAAFVNKVLLRYMLICLHVIHDFFVLQQQSSAVATQIVKETVQPAKPKWPVQMCLNSTVSSVIPSSRALYFNPLRPECCTKESRPGCTQASGFWFSLQTRTRPPWRAGVCRACSPSEIGLAGLSLASLLSNIQFL